MHVGTNKQITGLAHYCSGVKMPLCLHDHAVLHGAMQLFFSCNNRQAFPAAAPHFQAG